MTRFGRLDKSKKFCFAGNMRRGELARLENHVLEVFRLHRTDRLLTKTVFQNTIHSNADLVRAFKDMEIKWRLLIRFTQDGQDWIQLTAAGAEAAGLTPADTSRRPEVHLHPPKSST